MMPQAKSYNKYHSSFFQIIARMTALGKEAREFMIQAQALENLLNYFYNDASPYLKEFEN